MQEPDHSLDRYERLVRSTLRVPIGLVRIAESSRPLLPGPDDGVGLPEPGTTTAAAPFEVAFWRHAASARGPLVVRDARTDARVPTGAVVDGVEVRAYAGHPLLDARGSVIGALCALDASPRDWDDRELAVLADLAGTCSAELGLRKQRRSAQETEQQAVTATLTASVLLALSQVLADTRTMVDITGALHRIALDDLGALHAGIWLLRDQRLEYVANPDIDWEVASAHPLVPLERSNPLGAVALDKRPLVFGHDGAQDERFPDLIERKTYDYDGARAIMPLVVADEVLGVLAILWPERRDLGDIERSTLSALTRYTAQAVQRAGLLEERAGAAATLQNSMLTDLPDVPGLELVARYRTAAESDRVGGDWYDVVPLGPCTTALVVGDVVGHDMDAAAAMGQLRSLLRAFVWEGTSGPAASMQLLDRAARDLAIPSLATALLGILDVRADVGSDTAFVWTNAGHPAPILLGPDGTGRSLEGGNPETMLGVRPDGRRSDWQATLPPGGTLLLFTDGLLESSRTDVDTGRRLLLSALERHCRLSLGDLVDRVLDDLVDEHPADDVAVLAVRLPAQPSSERV